MKKLLIIACCLMHFVVYAQLKKEATFTVAENWAAILKRAKSEKKVIFVDAYATWCGPCKMMDSTVYNDPRVADFIKQNYIAVKVQIDKTNNDSQNIRMWYQDAEWLQKKYNIVALPTFIFINQENELLYRSESYQSSDQFLSLLKIASDPKSGFAYIMKNYEEGKTEPKDLLRISLRAKQYHQDSLAIEIAKKYKEVFINQNKPSSLLTEDLRDYIITFSSLFNLHDPLIQYIVEQPTKVDSVLKEKGLSVRLKEHFIVEDIINPTIKRDSKYTVKNPDWIFLEKRISKEFDKRTAKKLIINAKLNWYGDKKDWPNIIKYNIEKVDFLGIDTVGFGGSTINNMVFNAIFPHTNDPYALNKGIQYMETLLKYKPNADSWMDTYANLLYKTGRKKEALLNEEKALKLAIQNKDEGRRAEYEQTLQKMRNDLPTWEIN